MKKAVAVGVAAFMIIGTAVLIAVTRESKPTPAKLPELTGQYTFRSANGCIVETFVVNGVRYVMSPNCTVAK